MEIYIYDYLDYKSYLNGALKYKGHGAKKAMAEASGIQESFLSQVLRADADLSLEQGDRANKYLEHTNDESHFFLLLIQKKRAGTHSLKSYFNKLIDDVLERKKNLKEQIKAKSQVTDEDREKFYSSWQYAAVQIATSIKEYQTTKSLSLRLGISEHRLAEILEFLLASGLVVRDHDRFDMGTQSTHIGKDSSLVYKHHANWRLRALQKLEEQNPDHFHYSTVMSLSYEAVKQIQNSLSKTAKNANEIMEASKEEVLYALAIDCFEV
ncbi:MAG: DUF4423 domain-containing protein [Pseudomonadota bacterium]|nr:DUF4423 domain-containing protein [Pseudomonadota bacterium]